MTIVFDLYTKFVPLININVVKQIYNSILVGKLKSGLNQTIN